MMPTPYATVDLDGLFGVDELADWMAQRAEEERETRMGPCMCGDPFCAVCGDPDAEEDEDESQDLEDEKAQERRWRVE